MASTYQKGFRMHKLQIMHEPSYDLQNNVIYQAEFYIWPSKRSITNAFYMSYMVFKVYLTPSHSLQKKSAYHYSMNNHHGHG